MAASDVQPTRMGAARQAAKSFLDVSPKSFKISVVAFASTTRTLVKPTTDRDVVRAALDALQAEGGTAMGDAIGRGVEVAEEVRALASPSPTPVPPTAVVGTVPTPVLEKPPAAILLLSDGANTVGRLSPTEAARMARAAGIPVYTIALGTPDGVLEVPAAPGIPGLGGRGGRIPVRRIEVPPDERTLRQVAEITGGQFFSAPTASDLRAVYRDIGSRIGFEYERQEVTFAFAGAGAFLLVAAGALSLAWFQRVP
jgi:Ca-activated chloride channel family protein